MYSRAPKTQKNLCTHKRQTLPLFAWGFGGELVAHGLRSIARTAIEDIGLFDPIVVESCLAHGKKNEVEAAYNRSNYLVRRRPVMDWWGNYVTEAAKGVLLKGRLRAVNE